MITPAARRDARSSQSRTAYLLAALMLIGLGATGTLLLTRAGTPQILASPSPPGDIAVATSQWDDPRQASLTLTLGPAEQIVAPKPGLLTQSNCAPATTLKSGTVSFAVDGHPLLTLSTTTPLWRDLPIGTSGADAAALVAALQHLGQPVQGSTVTAAVVTAYDAVAQAAGAPTSGGTITRAGLIWIPKPEVTVVTCDTKVGSLVESGRPLASLTQTLVAARLTASPTDLVQGPRIFVVGAQRLALGPAGVDAEGLAWLASHPEQYQSGATPTVSGMLRLATALDVLPIPPSALGPVSTAGVSCVTTPDGPRSVTVVGSQLGTVYVAPETGTAIHSIVLDPARKQPCG